jgi:hypothetical protein
MYNSLPTLEDSILLSLKSIPDLLPRLLIEIGVDQIVSQNIDDSTPEKLSATSNASAETPSRGVLEMTYITFTIINQRVMNYRHLLNIEPSNGLGFIARAKLASGAILSISYVSLKVL